MIAVHCRREPARSYGLIVHGDWSWVRRLQKRLQGSHWALYGVSSMALYGVSSIQPMSLLASQYGTTSNS